jgi:hypothetical protein
MILVVGYSRDFKKILKFKKCFILIDIGPAIHVILYFQDVFHRAKFKI